VKRRSVACDLLGIVVNRDLEPFVGEASRPGFEDQIIPDDPQRFQIGRAAGLLPLLFEPALFLCGIGAGGGAILGLGHAASKRIRSH
jgi:hypothetical protein